MSTNATHTPEQVAEYLAVSARTVLEWIRTGELRAVNASRRANSGKPRWRITPAALAAFEAARSASPPRSATRTRRRRPSADVIEFYA